jgi:hypothetical protein
MSGFVRVCPVLVVSYSIFHHISAFFLPGSLVPRKRQKSGRNADQPVINRLVYMAICLEFTGNISDIRRK